MVTCWILVHDSSLDLFFMSALVTCHVACFHWLMLKSNKPSPLSTGSISSPVSCNRLDMGSLSSYSDEASLVAADWLGHHAATPPPGHTPLSVELGITTETWGIGNRMVDVKVIQSDHSQVFEQLRVLPLKSLLYKTDIFCLISHSLIRSLWEPITSKLPLKS